MNALPDGIRPPLLSDENDETLEVREVPSLLRGGALLSPGGLLPLLYNSLSIELLLDDTGAGCAGELGETERGEGEMLVGERLAGDTCCGAVDDCLYDIEMNGRFLV